MTKMSGESALMRRIGLADEVADEVAEDEVADEVRSKPSHAAFAACWLMNVEMAWRTLRRCSADSANVSVLG